MGHRVVVAVATRSRAPGLDGLLRALVGQRVSDGWDRLVVVVDNSPDGVEVERAVVHPGEVLVVHEPERGIPAARNRAVCVARAEGADVLAFVDDDEVPEGPDWLAAHLRTLEAGADVSTGPVHWVLPQRTHPWTVASGEFSPRDGVHGAEVHTASTANVALRLAAIADLEEPFDRRLVRRGGTDTLLFEQLHRRGARLRWTQDAAVSAPVGAERATMGWVLRRRLRTGGTRGAVQRLLDGAGSPVTLRRAGVGAIWSLLGIGQCLAGMALVPLRREQGRVLLGRGLRSTAFGVGTVLGALTGWVYAEYG